MPLTTEIVDYYACCMSEDGEQAQSEPKYEPPEFEMLGTFQELTKGSTSTGSDGTLLHSA